MMDEYKVLVQMHQCIQKFKVKRDLEVIFLKDKPVLDDPLYDLNFQKPSKGGSDRPIKPAKGGIPMG